MNKKIIGAVIVIIVFILGLYLLNKYPHKPITTPAPSSTIATYFCQEGTIIATYGQNSVSLGLSDGRNLDLPQTISGSGIRYEQGTTVFQSKGSDALLTEGDKVTYSNCVAGTQTTNGSINTFVDSTKLFSLQYPNIFTLSSGEQGYTASWRQGSQDLGLILVTASLPKSFQPGTNFSEGKFTVGTSAVPSAVTGCIVADQGGVVADKAVTIGGTVFTKITLSDAGAGNFYETTSYRTVRDGQCYAIEYTIHSTNIGNYPPDQHITAFDKTKVTGVLESLAQSFTFH